MEMHVKAYHRAARPFVDLNLVNIRFFAPDIDKAMQLLEEGRLVGLLPSVL